MKPSAKEEKYNRLISLLRQRTEEDELGCSINAAHQHTTEFETDMKPMLSRYFSRKTKLRLRLEKELKRSAANVSSTPGNARNPVSPRSPKKTPKAFRVD